MKEKYDIALVAPPWWLIPSSDIETATEYLVQEYGYYFNKKHKTIIFSRQKDETDAYDVEDIFGYENHYEYVPVTDLERDLFKECVEKVDSYGYNNSLLYYYSYIISVANSIKRYGIKKIIVFQTFSFCYWIKYINPTANVLYHIGNHELGKSEDYLGYFIIPKLFAEEVFPKIDKIICVSRVIEEAINKRFPKLIKKTTTIYPGIDSELFSFKEKSHDSDNRTIMYYGRIVREKGVHLLIQAFRRVVDEFGNKNLMLKIVGSPLGPNDNEAYYKQLEDMSAGYNVQLLGFVPRKELVKMLYVADVFVYPAVWDEPLGLAPLEAMATGTPVIVSDGKAGYLEIIEDMKSGLVFKNNDACDLAAKLQYLIENPVCRKKMAISGHQIVKEKLCWKYCSDETYDAFNRHGSNFTQQERA